MMLTDLLFIVLFLVAVGTLFAAGWFAARGEFGHARRILLRVLVGAAAYMLVVIVVSLILPRRVVEVGEPQCNDDWCIAIAGYKRVPEGDHAEYKVELRLSSQARRISQRENHVVLYLTDQQGRRYDSVADESQVPFNVLLGPQESVVASRSFVVPGDAAEVGAVIAYEGEGGFPIGWLIIGYDTWFRKPPLVKLP
jgi:hypothetical protein